MHFMPCMSHLICTVRPDVPWQAFVTQQWAVLCFGVAHKQGVTSESVHAQSKTKERRFCLKLSEQKLSEQLLWHDDSGSRTGDWLTANRSFS